MAVIPYNAMLFAPVGQYKDKGNCMLIAGTYVADNQIAMQDRPLQLGAGDMYRADGILKEEGYEVIRKYEGKITCEEAVRRIVERHKSKSMQAAHDGGRHEWL